MNGTARSGLAAVNVDTGSVDPDVSVPFTTPRTGALTVNRIAVRPDGSRLVALGSFTRVAGRERTQIAVLDLAGGPARLADWHTDRYAAQCVPVFNTYMRGVDISADGSFFVVVTTGGRARPTLCDTAARWELGVNGSHLQPTWVDYTGGDTLTGVAVTDAAVYVGGRPRWMNNPFNNGTGIDATPGPGAVPRQGIAALDPVNGLPLSWNPGRNPRGVGVFAFLATPKGLWVGTGLGLPRNLDLRGLPQRTKAMFPVAQLTGMAFDASTGRLYYTIKDDRRLFHRYFTAESGVVGGLPFAVSGESDGLQWKDVRGITLASGFLYYAKSDGALYRITLRDGSPVPGTAVSVDSSRNWASRGLFVVPR